MRLPHRPKRKAQTRWSDECSWPRRLLHVASMISYPWSSGNKYGPYKEPSYNAISYTWGRFQYKSSDPEYPDITPLAVHGVSWPLPRMRPSHFTADQLEKLLKNALDPEDGESPVEFLWLDVACIDQTEPRTPEYYSEIGRQAKIFRGAKDVVVWLTNTDGDKIKEWWVNMSRTKGPIKEVIVGGLESFDVDGWLDQKTMEFQSLRTDPWFTSLWTLQEAFLCPRAIILLRDGSPFFNCTNDTSSGGYLSHLIIVCQGMYSLLSQLERSQSRKATFSQPRMDALKTEIERFGFLEGFNQGTSLLRLLELGVDEESKWMGNPLMLLQASNRRTCYEDTDRVRGIMQVFELSLGESSPNHIPGKKYTLAELEDQLASELLLMYPITSQLFIQQRNCPSRRVWRINANMTMMSIAELLRRQMITRNGLRVEERKIVQRSNGATLRAQIFEGALMAHFRGHFSKMRTFVSVMERFISYDVTGLELEHKYKDRMERDIPGPIELRSQEFEWLANQGESCNMGIIFLARVQPPPNAPNLENVWSDWAIGLIICHEEGRTDVFEKVGIVYWNLKSIHGAGRDVRHQLTSELSDPDKYIVGKGSGWTLMSSYFG